MTQERIIFNSPSANLGRLYFNLDISVMHSRLAIAEIYCTVV